MALRPIPALLTAFLFLLSCSLAPMRPGEPEIGPAAERRLAELADRNAGLSTFKGIGTLRLYRNEGPLTARAAWIAQRPGRLRLELLGAAGTPLASLAADGGRFSLYLHDRGKGVQRRSTDDGMERVFGAPIRTAEVVSLLSGRVFLVDFQKATVRDGALVLEDEDGRLLQKIRSAGPEPTELVVERYEGRQSLVYRASMTGFFPVGGFVIPDTLRVSTPSGERLRLTVDRVWANPTPKPGAFELTPGKPAGREGR